MKKIILIYSGGLDSTVLLYDLINNGNEVKAITFDYGQRHSKEIEYATFHTEKLGISHKVIDLRSTCELYGDSALTNSQTQVPDGHYAEDSMKANCSAEQEYDISIFCFGLGYESQV